MTSTRVGLLGLCLIVALVAGCPRETAPTGDVNTASPRRSASHERAVVEDVVEATVPLDQDAAIVHHDITATINPDDHTIAATAIVGWLAPVDVSSVSFDLRSNLKISKLAGPDGVALKYSRDEDGRVTVPLDDPGESFDLTVEYDGEINGPRGGANNQRLWDYIGPEGTYVRFESSWYPQVWGDRATADIRLTVPEGWSAVTSGELVGQSGNEVHWHVSQPAAGLSFAAAEYTLAEDWVGDLPVRCYTFAKHKRRATEFIEQCKQILELYGELYGDYPFEKFAVVEIPDLYGGGHGDQGFVMLQESAFDGKLDTEFLAHEMAHNWWGSLILCTESEFLAEGFATYSQALWREHKEGAAGLREAMREQAESVLIHSLEPDEETSCFESESGPLLYEKGAWVLHMLRHQVGDTVWFKTVREFAEGHAGEVVTCKQFQGAFEEAHRKPLDWFFDQWLYGTGVPWVTGEVGAEGGGQVRVKLRQRMVTGEGDTDSLDLDKVWETAPGKLTLQIDLLVKLRRGETLRTVTMNLPEQDFIFNAGGEPTGLTIDPECRLLDHSKRQLTAASDS